ncbi:MAG: 3'-5' exonuclease [Chromatiales bacterium]|nr:MAG: 3'-5' exonuclease [Chromatiales bacterium]
MNCLVFDIETVPDTSLGRQLLNIDESLSDADVAKAMAFKRLQETESEFLPLHQHRIVAISVALRRRDRFQLWSLGSEASDEAELITRFFEGLEKYLPVLVSWNGSGFDLPLLHYRALKHSVASPQYWEIGDENREFRYNNYLGRFHWRHIDLMDVLSGYQPRSRAKLDEVAVMLGFPGKLGMSGDKVWDVYLQGGLKQIRDYCETDVLNTYLIYLRFQHLRGLLDDIALAEEEERVRAQLVDSEADHLREFLAAWQASGD